MCFRKILLILAWVFLAACNHLPVTGSQVQSQVRDFKQLATEIDAIARRREITIAAVVQKDLQGEDYLLDSYHVNDGHWFPGHSQSVVYRFSSAPCFSYDKASRVMQRLGWQQGSIVNLSHYYDDIHRYRLYKDDDNGGVLEAKLGYFISSRSEAKGGCLADLEIELPRSQLERTTARRQEDVCTAAPELNFEIDPGLAAVCAPLMARLMARYPVLTFPQYEPANMRLQHFILAVLAHVRDGHPGIVAGGSPGYQGIDYKVQGFLLGKYRRPPLIIYLLERNPCWNAEDVSHILTDNGYYKTAFELGPEPVEGNMHHLHFLHAERGEGGERVQVSSYVPLDELASRCVTRISVERPRPS